QAFWRGRSRSPDTRLTDRKRLSPERPAPHGTGSGLSDYLLSCSLHPVFMNSIGDSPAVRQSFPVFSVIIQILYMKPRNLNIYDFLKLSKDYRPSGIIFSWKAHKY